MADYDFVNDERFSIAPAWIIDRLSDEPFFSISEDDGSQNFHALIVRKGGNLVGIPVYDRKWIKFSVAEMIDVTEVIEVLSTSHSPSALNSGRAKDEFENGATPSESTTASKCIEKRPLQVHATKCEILGMSAATYEGEKVLLLTVRMNPHSHGISEIAIPLHQARERLQFDLADLLARSPVFKSSE
jgi:hypothetical protein